MCLVSHDKPMDDSEAVWKIVESTHRKDRDKHKLKPEGWGGVLRELLGDHRSPLGTRQDALVQKSGRSFLTSLLTTRIFLRWRLGFWGSLVSSALIRFLTCSAACKSKTQRQRQ